MRLCLHWADQHKGRLIIVLYCLYTAAFACNIYVRFRAPSRGDESFYVQQTEYLLEHGLTSALVDGNPIGFTLPIALMHKAGVPILMAGRVISLLSVVPVLIGIFYLGRHIVGLRPPMAHFVVVFSLQVISGSTCFTSSISDPLFSAVLLWGVIFLCKSLRNDQRWRHSIAAGILMGMALLIRPLALLHLPAFCLAALTLLLMTKHENPVRIVRTGITVVGIFAAFFFLQQLPSLIHNGTIAMENKNPRNRPVTWMQRQYLSQICYEDGTLPEGHHVPFRDVEQYLAKYGEDSLPRGLFQSLLWNPYRTIREFVKDLVLTSQYAFLRRTGLFYLISFLVLFRLRGLQETDKLVLFLLVLWFSFVCIISLMIITNVEWRWLILSVLLSCVCGAASLQMLFDCKYRIAYLLCAAQVLFLALSLAADLRNTFLLAFS